MQYASSPFGSLGLLVAGAFMVTSPHAFAQTYDLAADWSDVTNPFGPWRLEKAPGTLFTVSQPDFFPGTNQKAWADDPVPLSAHVPVWLKVTRPHMTGDEEIGDVTVHGSETDRTGSDKTSVVWVGPDDGVATVTGSLWMPRQIGRVMQWQLLKGGTVLTGGTLVGNGSTSRSNRISLAAGSGGATVLTQTVVAGDKIELRFISNPPTLGEVVGVNFAIALDTDTDNDGLRDSEEVGVYHTDPGDPDTDDDGLLDGAEVAMALGGNCPDPLVADSDGDSLSDGYEVNTLGTDPCNATPVAEAGSNQAVHVGDAVFLDGSGSSDAETPSQDLSYAWSFSSRPSGSTATISGADTSTPSFVVDSVGDYVVSLVVADAGGLSSDADEVTISSLNAPPNANAGPDQGTYVGDLVFLDGSASDDPDLDPIFFEWAIVDAPAGSAANLSGADTPLASFVPDLIGTYEVELVVDDGFSFSIPDLVIIVVVAPAQFAATLAMDALNFVTALPSSAVTTTGNQTAMVNSLLQAIQLLQNGKIDQAKTKLRQAIERTDGCALRGSPDPAGGGGGRPPAQDYLTNCADQAEVYASLQEALESLGP